jgi:hypothetical protein
MFMGWLSELLEGFGDGLQTGSELYGRKTEQLQAQKEKQEALEEKLNAYMYQRDSTLLSKLQSPIISEDEREYIEEILKSRGYRKNKSGVFNRKVNNKPAE